MSKKAKVSNERKSLHRLSGECLGASRLTQRGFMVALQWGTTIGYDILVFDKKEHVAYLEVKSSASNSRRWVLQKKYASPRDDAIPADRRFVWCVHLAVTNCEPKVYLFPADVVATGLHYLFSGKFPNSSRYHLSLDFKPQGKTKMSRLETAVDHINTEPLLRR